jgi:hypothetical protein
MPAPWWSSTPSSRGPASSPNAHLERRRRGKGPGGGEGRRPRPGQCQLRRAGLAAREGGEGDDLGRVSSSRRPRRKRARRRPLHARHSAPLERGSRLRTPGRPLQSGRAPTASSSICRSGRAPVKPARYWQIWNEPNLPNYWWNSVNPTEYGVFLRGSLTAAKRGNAYVRVVSAGLPWGSTGMWPPEFLSRMFRLWRAPRVPKRRRTDHRVRHRQRPLPVGGRGASRRRAARPRARGRDGRRGDPSPARVLVLAGRARRALRLRDRLGSRPGRGCRSGRRRHGGCRRRLRAVRARGRRLRRRLPDGQSSSCSSGYSPPAASPARRMTICSGSTTTVTGRWPAQCSA